MIITKMIPRVLIPLAFLIMSFRGQQSLIRIPQHCLGCICEAISLGNCFADIGCDGHGLCGPFRISYNYWKKAGAITLENDTNPMGAWKRCLDDHLCASRVVVGFMDRYGEDCDGDGTVDCYDIAQIHHLGRCSKFSNLEYKNNIINCFENPSNYTIVVAQISAGVKKNQRKPPKLIPISDHCFTCICQAAFGNFCPVETSCERGKCGPFRIDRDYWTKAGRITMNDEKPETLGAFERCAVNTKCASRIVQGYMNKFASDCDNDGIIACQDYAHIHKHGSCQGKIDISYERKFLNCVMYIENDLPLNSSLLS